jgi:hypothetical protein
MCHKSLENQHCSRRCVFADDEFIRRLLLPELNRKTRNVMGMCSRSAAKYGWTIAPVNRKWLEPEKLSSPELIKVLCTTRIK